MTGSKISKQIKVLCKETKASIEHILNEMTVRAGYEIQWYH
jgi:hypothetical protein